MADGECLLDGVLDSLEDIGYLFLLEHAEIIYLS